LTDEEGFAKAIDVDMNSSPSIFFFFLFPFLFSVQAPAAQEDGIVKLS